MSTTRPRPPALGRRAQIRSAAIELFDERGYHGTSMQDIASALNVRASALYNHVDSKQELLLEIIAADIEAVIDAFEAAIATTDDPVEQLRRGTEAHIRHHARSARASHIGIGELTSLEEPGRTEMLERRRAYGRAWREVVERGIETGDFHVTDVFVTTSSLVDMGIGVSRWFREDGPMSDGTLAVMYGDIALRVVGAQPEKRARREQA